MRQGYKFAISAKQWQNTKSIQVLLKNQLEFWDTVLQAISIIAFDELSVDTAVTINHVLKGKRKQIDLADLFYWWQQKAKQFKFLATLNKKHFGKDCANSNILNKA